MSDFTHRVIHVPVDSLIIDFKDITDWAFYFERVTVDIYMYRMGTGVACTVCIIKFCVAWIFQFSNNTDLGYTDLMGRSSEVRINEVLLYVVYILWTCSTVCWRNI